MNDRAPTSIRTDGEAAGQRASAASRARAYLVAFTVATFVSVAFFYGALALLLAVDRLPPPPVSGTWCIDSRFAWLKRVPEWKTAKLTAVGSSTTWRNLDFSVAPSELASQGIANTAPCFLTINQTRYLAEYLLGRAPATKTLLTVVTLRDVAGCSRNPTAFFDPKLADDYLEEKSHGWWLYFRNFRLTDVFFHALYAGERRPQMQYDRFGSGPLIRPTADVGHAFQPEAACYGELRQLATMLDAKGIQFVVVTFPVMHGWAQQFDPSGAARAGFRAGVEAALASTGAVLVDGMSEWQRPDAAFTDPVHLQWPETAAFTRFVLSVVAHKDGRLRPTHTDSAQSESSLALSERHP